LRESVLCYPPRGPHEFVHTMEGYRSFTEGSVSRGLIQFALPILYTNVLQSLNGSVNSMWVGHFLGESALTATSNANLVLFLLVGAAFGIVMAATIRVGQCIGAKDLGEAKRVVGTGATFLMAVSICMGIGGLMVSRAVLMAMETPSSALPLAVPYMQVMFLSMPFLYMYVFVMSMLNAAGDSRTPLYFMLLTVAVDIGLNPVFIFGVGFIPRLGITGSALATCVAQGIGLVALIIYLYSRQHPLRLRRHEFGMLRVDWSIVHRLVLKGVPIGTQILVLSMSGILMITLVNRFGVDTTAAFGTAIQLWTYTLMPAISMGAAVSSMVAQNVGAQNRHRVSSIVRTSVVLCTLLTGTFVLVIQLLDSQAYSLFLPSGSHALDLARHVYPIVAWSSVFLAISTVLFNAMSATGTVIAPLLIQTLTFLVARFLFAEILLDRWQADAIWWSFPTSSALAVVFIVLYYKYGEWWLTRKAVAAKSLDVL